MIPLVRLVPLRLMSTPKIYARIAELEKEQLGITRDLYRGDLDPLSRVAIDAREKALITELIELKTERMRRGRAIAESMGVIVRKEKKP